MIKCEKCGNILELPELIDQWDDFPMTELTCKCGHINTFQWYGTEILQWITHSSGETAK